MPRAILPFESESILFVVTRRHNSGSWSAGGELHRRSLDIGGTGLRIHPLAVVGLPVTVLFVGVAWLAVGAVLVGPLPEPTRGTIGSVTTATVAVFLTRGVTTVRTYFSSGAPRDHNAQTALGGLFTKIVIVFFTSIVTLVTVGAVTAGPDAELTAIDSSAVGGPLLLVIVGLKFTSEYLSAYHDRLAVYFRWSRRSRPGPDRPRRRLAPTTAVSGRGDRPYRCGSAFESRELQRL